MAPLSLRLKVLPGSFSISMVPPQLEPISCRYCPNPSQPNPILLKNQGHPIVDCWVYLIELLGVQLDVRLLSHELDRRTDEDHAVLKQQTIGQLKVKMM